MREMKFFNMRNVEEDITIGFSKDNDALRIKEKENTIRHTINKRLNFLKKSFNSTNNIRKLEDSSASIITLENETYEKKRFIKFYIDTLNECSVIINDTVTYDSHQITNPIDHTVLHTQNDYKVRPKGVYSNDLHIDYYGFSNDIKTFTTYFKNNNESIKNEANIEYLYKTRNLIESFSDFRNGTGYDNVKKNYNLLAWNFINLNNNKQNQTLVIELIFDLGENFIKDEIITNTPMDKNFYTQANRTIVKFHTKENIILNFNQSYKLEFEFPLYFENCKNYKMNLLVFGTGLLLISFLGLVIHRTFLIMCEV